MTTGLPHRTSTSLTHRGRGRALRRLAALAAAIVSFVPAVHAEAAGGALDTGFAGTGFVTTPVGPGDQQALGVALAPGGKIVVAGMTQSGSYPDTVLTRYNADGTLDTSFDGDGKVLASLSNRTDRAWAVAVQPDGKIVIAGDIYDSGPGTLRMFVARFTTAGKLDTSFAATGLRMVTLPNANDGAGFAIKLLADGRIVVAGKANFDTAVLRLKSDGSYDTTLGGDGLATISTDASFDEASALEVLADGRMVLTGASRTGPQSKIQVVRLLANGLPDASFNTVGIVTTALFSPSEGNALVVQPDGKIVVAGRTGSPTNPVMLRYTTDGSLDSSFHATGILQLTDRSFDYFTGVALQPNGKLLGIGANTAPVPREASVTRVTADGFIDSAYATNGIARVRDDATSLGSYAAAGVLQPDGRLVVAGEHRNTALDYDLLVARFEAEPAGCCASPQPAQPVPGGSAIAAGMTVVAPTRILDTRSGPKPASSSVVKVMTGAPSGTTAVLVNLTMTQAESGGFVTADRCSSFTPGSVPGKSNGNFAAGVDIANLNVVPVDADGSFCLYTSAPVHLLADLQGIHGSTGMVFTASAPTRVLDTRSTGKPAAGSVVKIASGAPAGAKAVLVNLTMTRADAAGYVTADTCSAFAAGPVTSSNGNFTGGVDIANGTVVPVDPDGSFCLVASALVDLIVDVQGSYREAAGLSLKITTPTRMLDTRTGAKPAAGSITKVSTGAPAGITSLFVNLTMTRAEGVGYVTADKCSTLANPPSNSNGKFRPGVAIAKTTVVPVDADGSFCLYTSAPVDLIVDVQGVY